MLCNAPPGKVAVRDRDLRLRNWVIRSRFEDNRALTIDTLKWLDLIVEDVFRAIQLVRQQQPEWLREKYRAIDWQQQRYQSALKVKLTEIIEPTSNSEEAIANLKAFLQKLFINEFFQSPIFRELLASLRSRANNLAAPDSESARSGIAVLLLDAENLQLDAKTENFLTSACTCPLRIKIAFANWRSLGKLDRELHARGYDLMHVPGGRDHADGKMIAVGLSLWEHYPTAREVLVCSSDTVMTNLCNHLQKKGLTVYRASQHGDSIEILNCQTNRKQTFSPNNPADIPSLEAFTQQLKELIQAEQKSTQNHWVKLSRISQSFRQQYQRAISQVVSYHFPGKRARDFFLDRREDFVVHQTSDSTELYLTLFQTPSFQDEDVPNERSPANPQSSPSKSSLIQSSEELEQILVKLVNTSISKGGESVSLEVLGGAFHKQYGEGITKVLKRLQVGSSFPQFLQSLSALKLKKNEKSYQISSNPNSVSSARGKSD